MPNKKNKQMVVSRGSTPVVQKSRNQSDEKKQSIQGAALAYGMQTSFQNHKKASGTPILRRSECIGDVYGSTGFATKSYSINPGLADSFPWLSIMAKDWQQYRFSRLIVRFVTRVSANTKGSVILSPEYNVNDGPPLTENEARNTQDSVEGNCWAEISVSLDCKAMFAFGLRKQIRTSNIGADLSTYDAVLLTVATIGLPDNSVIGQLWLDYDVEFFVPQSTLSTRFISNRVCEFTLSTDTVLSQGTEAGVFATNLVVINNPFVVDYSTTAGAFVLPRGVYRIDIWVNVNGNATADLSSQLFFRKDNSPFGPTCIMSGASSGGYGSQNVNSIAFMYGTPGGEKLSPRILCYDSAVAPTIGMLAGGTRMLISLV